ncbi:MAG: hypothetical protein KDD37_05805 [Bdellovibrionales bacterium]|nr:hypothetical protein [Bdellovibrionales bacterium]
MIFLFLLSFVYAINIPTNLTEKDRDEVLKVLGVGTSSKYNSVPRSLGGFSGLEIALSIESLPADKLNDLGDGVDNSSSFDYAKISIGKGLFHFIDMYAHFIPFDKQTGLSEYGAMARWRMFEIDSGRFSVASLIHFNSSNIEDLFISDSYGGQIHLVWHILDFDVYGGIGLTRVKGRFSGGNNAITDTGLEIQQKINEELYILGASYIYKRVFIAVEANKADYLSLAAKLGLRF